MRKTAQARSATAKVSSQGRISIPAELRRKYRLEPGSVVRFIDYGGVLTMVPELRDPVREGRGALKGETSLTQALLEDRRREREREDL